MKGRMQLVKAIAAVKGRSNKSLKGKWHTLWRGKTVYIFIRYYYDVQKGFCPVFGEELLLTEIKEKST